MSEVINWSVRADGSMIKIYTTNDPQWVVMSKKDADQLMADIRKVGDLAQQAHGLVGQLKTMDPRLLSYLRHSARCPIGAPCECGLDALTKELGI